jgi:16S rRNA (guanine527-N7)-methyltransferase
MALAPLGSRWIPLVERALEELAGRHAERGERTHHANFSETTGTAGVRENIRDAIPSIVRYLDDVAEWNQRTDLTAARSPEELVDLTLADALVVTRSAAPAGTWIDVGSGAGAPGLVVALLLPTCPVTLVEPRDKRVAFLRSVVGRLGLVNVTVVRGRSEGVKTEFDVALSRATLPPREWLAEGARLARSVWVLVAREEAPTLPGFVVVEDIRYEWPLTSVERRAVRYAAENLPRPAD